MWKSEILNWDGTVYSTTTQTLNARGQATLIRQYAGTDQSSTFQDTTMSYDGYGRLQTKHVPEQQDSSGNPTYTTWEYNADDTLHKVTDARGAIATYGYNNRHLVTSINYSAPTGIPTTPNVTFGYDAAGNRTSMSNGNSGVTYQYDQLSRLQWEERTFTGLTGAYRLTYGYNLADELTSVLDPWGTQTNYTHDSSGRLSSVTGSGPGSASTYVSSFQYRATDAVTSVTYSNGVQLTVGYSSRLQPTGYNLTSQNSQNPTVMNVGYAYSGEGRLRNSTDNQDATLDRAYKFDHAGRLSEAYTGSEARTWVQTNGGSIGTTIDGPYRQTFSHDAFDNPIQKWTRSFTGTHLRQQTVSYSYNSTTNRNTAWSYDANGSVSAADGVENTLDAAGQIYEVSNGEGLLGRFAYDGDGEQVKKTSDFGNSIPTQTFYLRSSVLDHIVSEIGIDGTRLTGFVYADGELIATQSAGAVFWQHRDPSNRSLRTTDASGSMIGKQELDPSDVKVDNPQQPPRYSVGGGGTVGRDPGGIQARVASLMNTGICEWAGMMVPCASIERFAQSIREAGPLQQSMWYSGTGAFVFVVRKPPRLHVLTEEEKKKAKKEAEKQRRERARQNSQNAARVPLPTKDAIRDRIKTGDCNTYIASLIAKAGELYSNYGNVPVAKDGLDLLDKINNFVLEDNLRVDGYGAAGTVRGSILGNNMNAAGSATVVIGTKFVFPNDPVSRINYWQQEYIDTAIHEMLHLVGRYSGYDDRQLAVAASKLPGANPNLPAAPKDYKDSLAYQYNSGYWDAELKKHCGAR